MHNKRKISGNRFVAMAMILFMAISVNFWICLQCDAATKEKGSFYLVGMGPGDP